MKNKVYKNRYRLVILISLFVFVFSFSVGTLFAEWTEPSNPPYTFPGFPQDSAGTVETGCNCQSASLKQPSTMSVLN